MTSKKSPRYSPEEADRLYLAVLKTLRPDDRVMDAATKAAKRPQTAELSRRAHSRRALA